MAKPRSHVACFEYHVLVQCSGLLFVAALRSTTSRLRVSLFVKRESCFRSSSSPPPTMAGAYVLLQFGDDPFSLRFEDLECRPAFTVYVRAHAPPSL
jgi:hypothetical protein